MRRAMVCSYVLALILSATGGAMAGWTVTILAPAGSTYSCANGVYGDTQVGYCVKGGDNHAGFWNGTSENWTDIGAEIANGVYGDTIVGVTGQGYAMLWQVSGGGANLHPAGWETSTATGVYGDTQVGYVQGGVDSYAHACLWKGAAASWVDLGLGWAYGVYADTQVGTAFVAVGHGGLAHHAALWKGWEGSLVDLNPGSTYDFSEAMAVYGDTQVGYCRIEGSSSHAALWKGTAASLVDLNPEGHSTSWATGVYGEYQVGVAWTGPSVPGHAGLWNGTAASWVDLHALLPSGYSGSWAYGVSGTGGELSIVGTADNKAVLWHYTPEHISGAVTLENWSAPGTVSVPSTIKYRVSGGTVQTVDTTLSVTSSGGKGTATYKIDQLQAGVYDLLIKPSHWLASKIAGVDVSSGSVDDANVTCKNGDIDGNNTVNFSDYLWLQSQYKKTPGSPSADLNGDGKADFSDYLILQANYKKAGDVL